MRWQIRDAKAKLSEVIEKAITDGPQMNTRHGVDRAVLVSIKDYQALLAGHRDFRSHLLGGPRVEGFEVERDRSAERDNPC
jgi:antitoxin Phd